MRTFSFIVAFALALAGPSLVRSSDTSLPGPGTFSYNGSAVNFAASPVLVADAR
jgi:hypothetical protein